MSLKPLWFTVTVMFATPVWGSGWRLLPFTTSYVVHSSGLDIGRLEQTLRPLDDQRFAMRTESFATGMAALLLKERTVEESLFRVSQMRIVPLEYRFDRSGGNRSKVQKFTFDWSSKKIKGQTDDNRWELAWEPEAFDNLLYQIGMLRDAALGKTEMDYQIVDNAELKHYRFVRKGEETVETPTGKYQAVVFERINMQDKRATKIWSAPKLNYLPVRIDNVDRKGREATLLLEKVSGQVTSPRP